MPAQVQMHGVLFLKKIQILAWEILINTVDPYQRMLNTT